MKSRSSFPIVFFLAGLLLLTPSCNTSKTFQGAVVGGALGGIIGGTLSKKGKKARGILIGSAIGGTAGALIGKYMDRQAEELRRDMEGAKVERVGEGILITFDSGLLFDVDSYQLRSATRSNLNELGRVLKKYDDTEVLIQGHTDSTGSEDYNLQLSNDRARSVFAYLITQGVSKSRLITMGLGEGEPIGSNATASGRQKNRRVEVVIVANKKLQRAAKKGQI